MTSADEARRLLGVVCPTCQFNVEITADVIWRCLNPACRAVHMHGNGSFTFTGTAKEEFYA